MEGRLIVRQCFLLLVLLLNASSSSYGALLFDAASPVISPPPSKYSLRNRLALTPPMGWNSWNHFACNINEDLIKQTADAMVSRGLSSLGYQYINIDDCWGELNRDSQGNLVAKASTFPSGIKALADYIIIM